MAKNLIISGLKEVSREDCVQVVKTFFQEKMKLDNIEIKIAYHLGKGEHWPMVIKLPLRDIKMQVLAKKSELKDVRNEKGRKYYIISSCLMY